MKPACQTGTAIATGVAALIATAAPPFGVASADHAKGKCIGANRSRALIRLLPNKTVMVGYYPRCDVHAEAPPLSVMNWQRLMGLPPMRTTAE
jgi:hypothetical protein